jgi:hypothetical protein
LPKKQKHRGRGTPPHPADSVSTDPNADAVAAQAQLDAEYRKELVVKQDANSNAYDTQILALSSGALGLSLVFLKDIVPIAKVVHRELLALSWGFFILAILSTLASFLFSQKAISRALDELNDPDIPPQEQSRFWAYITEVTNWASGSAFFLGVVVTAIFVWLNIQQPVSHDKSPKETAAGQVTPSSDKTGGSDGVSDSSRPARQSPSNLQKEKNVDVTPHPSPAAPTSCPTVSSQSSPLPNPTPVPTSPLSAQVNPTLVPTNIPPLPSPAPKPKG